MGNIFAGMMLDTGSGVNTVPELIVVDVVNFHQEKRFDDPEHPIKRFEEWDDDEHLQGVAAGHPIRMIGQVVVGARLVECGKETGPLVYIRFKICALGSTDWAGIILGARALDCGERGGLGLRPMNDCHFSAVLEPSARGRSEYAAQESTNATLRIVRPTPRSKSSERRTVRSTQLRVL